MEIDYLKVKDGQMNGEVVWICQYNRPDLNKKALRNVKPTKVKIFGNSYTKKRVYYSRCHFKKLNKKDEPLMSSCIPLFDNTGFRSRTGDPLHIFSTEEECIESWNNQISKAMDNVFDYKIKMNVYLDKEHEKLSEMMIS